MTDDPHQELGQGHIRHYPTMLAATNALVKAPEPYKQIIYDNGVEARELDGREEALLERVCSMLGYEVEEVDG